MTALTPPSIVIVVQIRGTHTRLFLTVAVVLAVATYRWTPLWPGPSLPPGATQLTINTEKPHLLPTMACPTALLAPFRIAAEGNELVLISVGDDRRQKVVWPSGWAAWRRNGHAELANRDGAIIGREGEILSDLGGGVGLDDAFHVCVPWG